MGAAAIAAHMFVFYFSCYSNITPPVAIASYTAAGIAGAKPLDVAMWGLRIAAPGFIIPFLFVYNPTLLLEAYTVPSLIIVSGASIIGVIFMAVGGVGYMRAPLHMVTRCIFVAASVLMIIPEYITTAVGVILLVIGMLFQRQLDHRRTESARTE